MNLDKGHSENTGMGFILLTCIVFYCHVLCAQENGRVDAENMNPTPNDSLQQEQSILQYQDQITERESLSGPYDPQLGEELLGLGLLYKNQGSFKEAAEALERSLNIKRINEGIQDMSQVPVLNALIEVNSATKSWDDLDQNYHLLLWVMKRNLKSGDPALLPFIEAAGRWKLIAYSNGLLDEPPERTLRNMIDVYQSTVDTMEELYGKNDPRLIGPLNGLSVARYQLVKFANSTPVTEYQSTERRTIIQRECTLVLMPDGLRRVCYDQQVPNPVYYAGSQITKDSIVRNHMNSVRETLKRVADINTANPSIGVRDHALALVNLGDWYFLNRKKGTAFDNYRQAYQLLDSSGQEQETIESLFGNPVLLPSLIKNPYINYENIQSNGEPFVKITFDVRTNGRTRKIKVIEGIGQNNVSQRRSARQYIKSSLFRPRFENGEPVETTQMVMQLSGPILHRRSNQGATGTGSRIRR